jgi:putative salt-induced outer membrane protein YdiY
MPSRQLISSLVTAALVAASSVVATPALAQAPSQPAPPAAPPPPPPVWTVSASAGWSFTHGNSDTSSVNLGYNIVYDPQTKNVIKSDGLFLRTKDHGELSADRLGLNGRDEYHLTDRAYVFGQVQYLRDQFKDIDYLVAPTAGLGYKLIKMPNTELAVDGGAGVTWEKDTGLDLDTSGAVMFDDKFTQKLSPNATLTQTFSALWKTKDFGDALYITGLSLAAGLTAHTQLKIEWIDTYKREPPSPAIQRNDNAIVFALVYKTGK